MADSISDSTYVRPEGVYINQGAARNVAARPSGAGPFPHPNRPGKSEDPTSDPAPEQPPEQPEQQQQQGRSWQNIPGTNKLDRLDRFVRKPGEPMVISAPDTRKSLPLLFLLETSANECCAGVPNCSIFHFSKEDHTLGNLLKYKLHENRAVLFSGYKVPHPMYAEFDLRIQTDGSITPKEALEKACRDTITELGILDREFTKEMELFKVRNMATGLQPGPPGPPGAPGPSNIGGPAGLDGSGPGMA